MAEATGFGNRLAAAAATAPGASAQPPQAVLPEISGLSGLREPPEQVNARLLLHLAQTQVDKSIPKIDLDKLPAHAGEWKDWLRKLYRKISAMTEDPRDCRLWLSKIESATDISELKDPGDKYKKLCAKLTVALHTILPQNKKLERKIFYKSKQ